MADGGRDMAHKQITQTGLNRAMWRMLVALGGKFVVKASDVETVNSNAAIKIDHVESKDEFVFRLIRTPDAPKQSLIITPGMN